MRPAIHNYYSMLMKLYITPSFSEKLVLEPTIKDGKGINHIDNFSSLNNFQVKYILYRYIAIPNHTPVSKDNVLCLCVRCMYMYMFLCVHQLLL